MLLAPEKLKDPSWAFLNVLTSLYFTNKVTPHSGSSAAETLCPEEAFILGMMTLTKTYNSRNLTNLLYRKYRTFDSRECDTLTEVGILGLIKRGYLKPASKAAAKALEERDMEVWGLGDVPFIVTAKGAARIAHLVGNFTGENAKEVVKKLQAESKEAAQHWIPDTEEEEL